MDKGEKGLAKLDTIFECSICCEMFNTIRVPMSLPCGHSLCAYCIANMTSSDGVITCPIDKLDWDASECSKNYSYAEALEAVELLIAKLQSIKISNPVVKKKLNTLQSTFSRRDAQQAKDLIDKPVLKPKVYWVDANTPDDSFEDYGYDDPSGYSSPYDSSYCESFEVYEESKSVELCLHYLRYRTCKYGDRCKYSHEVPYGAHVPKYPDKICFRMKDNGYCQFGSKCWYSHNVTESSVDSGQSWDGPADWRSENWT